MKPVNLKYSEKSSYKAHTNVLGISNLKLFRNTWFFLAADVESFVLFNNQPHKSH